MDKIELRMMWSDTTDEVTTYFSQFNEETFAADRDGRWCYARNLDHLIRSVKPVAFAMRLPKVMLRLLFGRASGSTTYQEVHGNYQLKLKEGAVAPRAFVATKLESRQILLARWVAVAARLNRALDAWEEGQLDHIRLPHPILGRISVREMLFFTDLHARHHLDNCRNT